MALRAMFGRQPAIQVHIANTSEDRHPAHLHYVKEFICIAGLRNDNVTEPRFKENESKNCVVVVTDDVASE